MSSAWEPSSATLPLATTTILSAFRIVEGAVRNHDGRAPAPVSDSISASSAACTTFSDLLSSAEVASSRSSTLGSLTMARAMATLPAARQLLALVAHLGVVPLGEGENELVGVGRRGGGRPRGLELLRAQGHRLVREPVGDVLEDGPAEELGLLAHHGQLAAQPLDVELLQVHAVQRHGAPGGVVDALQEVHDGALARPDSPTRATVYPLDLQAVR